MEKLMFNFVETSMKIIDNKFISQEEIDFFLSEIDKSVFNALNQLEDMEPKVTKHNFKRYKELYQHLSKLKRNLEMTKNNSKQELLNALNSAQQDIGIYLLLFSNYVNPNGNFNPVLFDEHFDKINARLNTIQSVFDSAKLY